MGSFSLCNCSGYGKWAQLLPLHAFPCSQMRIIIFLTADPLKYWICNQYNTSQNKQQIKSRLFVYIIDFIVPLFGFLSSQKSAEPRWDECKFLSNCQSIKKGSYDNALQIFIMSIDCTEPTNKSIGFWKQSHKMHNKKLSIESIDWIIINLLLLSLW